MPDLKRTAPAVYDHYSPISTRHSGAIYAMTCPNCGAHLTFGLDGYARCHCPLYWFVPSSPETETITLLAGPGLDAIVDVQEAIAVD